MEWFPDDMSNPSVEWWRDTLSHHAEALQVKTQGCLAQATVMSNGCWELGTAERPARIQWRGKRLRVYQLVAWANVAQIPLPRSVVRHLCNNRACINPDHLAVGTQAQNLFDQRQKRLDDIAQDWSHP